MKLHILYANRYAQECNMIHLGYAGAPIQRLVTIELTPEQAAKLEPEEVGFDSGIMRREELDRIWLEKGDDNA